MRLMTMGLVATLLAGPLPAEAQEAGKVPLIGFLHLGGGSRVKHLREDPVPQPQGTRAPINAALKPCRLSHFHFLLRGPQEVARDLAFPEGHA